MKIVTYNVNGLRSAISKGLLAWVEAELPNVLCLQEIKALPKDIDMAPWEALGYKAYWHPAQKLGYSGVATFSRLPVERSAMGTGIEKYDLEGRMLLTQHGNLHILNTYMPSGSSGDERQAFKYEWLADFLPIATKALADYEQLIICGDYNICHKAIDIHNPKSNAKSSGFLPEERAWMDSFVAAGFVDPFRLLHPDGVEYSWWSYRAGARGKNLGWRIDYLMLSPALAAEARGLHHAADAKHSDHCPVVLELALGGR